MNPSPYQSRRIWPGRVAPVPPTAFTLIEPRVKKTLTAVQAAAARRLLERT
jgi:hypothetical protein